MNRREFLKHTPAMASTGLLGSSLLPATLRGQAAAAPARPLNVLFIVIDDDSPYLHTVFKNSPVPTPNMQRVADRGTWFSRGYADVPLCCPSRTALLTGVHACRSGVYDNTQAYRRTSSWISKVENLPQHFLHHGYLTAGYGKIAHNQYLDDDIGAFTPGYYKMMDHPADVTHTDVSLLNYIIPGTFTKSWAKTWWPWGVLPDDWDRDDPAKLQQDTEQANRTMALVGQKQEQPFFTMCGFFKPHTSWTVPKRYFDRFPLDKIEVPPGYRADDLEDVPAPGRELATHRGEHDYIVRNGEWRKHLQGFYATIAYVDDQIGRVLDALEQGPNRDNTIVILAADNGFHTGEKNHWSKTTLWEEACRVVFTVSVPGLKPQICPTPVSLLDIYPTLLNLCNLPKPTTHTLDGFDLTPILRGTTTVRGAPVLNTCGRGNHAIVDERFRYIRYAGGEEELYDHDNDPWEWTNLAADHRFDALKGRLSAYLPSVNAPAVERAGKGEGD